MKVGKPQRVSGLRELTPEAACVGPADRGATPRATSPPSVPGGCEGGWRTTSGSSNPGSLEKGPCSFLVEVASGEIGPDLGILTC